MSDKAIPVVDDEGQNSGYSTADKDKGAADSKGFVARSPQTITAHISLGLERCATDLSDE